MNSSNPGLLQYGFLIIIFFVDGETEAGVKRDNHNSLLSALNDEETSKSTLPTP